MKGNVLFGDTFGTKADYSSGVFYAGRRRYLTGKSAENEGGIFVPPKEFMTRKQAQKIIRLEHQVPKVKAMHFEHARRPSDHSIESFQRQKARGQHQMRETLPLARCAPRTPASKPRVMRSEWEKEYEAGCWYWRNTVTGELTDVCPFPDSSEEDRLLSPNAKRLVQAQTPIDDPEAACPVVPNSGTGAVVYDSRGYEELLQLLDTAPSPPRSPSKRSTKKT